MNKDQLIYFRTLLENSLEVLLFQSKQTLSEMISQSGQEIEYFDQVSTQTDQLMKLRIKSRESRLIKKIRNALQRIDDQTYGICEVCGEDISFRRLEARPVTTKCISCKVEEERLERLAS